MKRFARRGGSLGAPLLLLVLGPAVAAGQARDGEPRDAHRFGVSWLAPTLRVPFGRITVDAATLALSRDGGMPGIGATARVGLDVVRGAGLEVAARVAGWGPLADASDPLRGSERGVELVRRGEAIRAWTAWTAVRPGGSLRGEAATRLEAGSSWTTGRFALGLALAETSLRDSVRVRHDTTLTLAGYDFRSPRTKTILTDVSYTDAETWLAVRVGPARFDAVLGVRRGTAVFEGDAWARVRASVELAGSAWLADAAIGIRPSVPERGMPAARFLSLGVAWTPGRSGTEPSPARSIAPVDDPRAPRLEVERLEDGTLGLLLRNVPGGSVDVMGDFTEWRSTPATPRGTDTWLLYAGVEPGTWGYLVRVDGGGWHVPRGLPARPGDFGSPVGVTVVRAEGS